MPQFTQHTLTSSYNNLTIKVMVAPGNKNASTTLLLHPGAFEFLYGDGERYRIILEWLQKHLSFHPNIATYETSRASVPKPRFKKDTSYWSNMEIYWKQLFDNKTFQHELDDVRKVMKFLLKNKEVTTTTIYSLGFSLGGTLAILLSNEFKQLQKIYALGSAASTKRPQLPVLTGYPSKTSIFEVIRKFSGSLSIAQGSNEKVVPVEDAFAMFQMATNVEFAQLLRVKDADHMFSGNNTYNLTNPDTLLPSIQQFFESTIS